jgi:hypothetical protein
MVYMVNAPSVHLSLPPIPRHAYTFIPSAALPSKVDAVLA